MFPLDFQNIFSLTQKYALYKISNEFKKKIVVFKCYSILRMII